MLFNLTQSDVNFQYEPPALPHTPTRPKARSKRSFVLPFDSELTDLEGSPGRVARQRERDETQGDEDFC